ncbi:hypothetical protein INR49_013543 [Caranx melampygus]|nr:hypothetical protein INR49_013543 [Caranx melampygus]
MIMLWVTLLILHRGYSLVPVITAQLGQPVTFTCDLFDVEIGSSQIHWYKQSAGDYLKLIVSKFKTTEPKYASEFSESRFKTNIDKRSVNLTIVRTTQEDEGLYHCAVLKWVDIEWSGTYLLVKGNSQRTSNYTVVQRLAKSGPVHPGDAVTLQCSVFSESDNKTCPGDHSVYWFRAGSDESHPNIIYTGGNQPGKCEGRTDPRSAPKGCIYRFAKNISSSDAGTYYCAVATCGQMLFGNGTKVDIVPVRTDLISVGIFLIVCLVISVVGNIFLLCSRRARKQYKGMEQNIDSHLQARDNRGAEDRVNYAALQFSERKTRGRDQMGFAEADNSLYSEVIYQ